MGGRRLPGALHKIAIGSHGPRHPLDDAALQPILEAVDEALRPADQDVGVRAQLLVGPSQNVSEVGARADGREHELRGGAGVAGVLLGPVWKSTSVSGAQFFTKSLLGDVAVVLARSSGEEPASPRHRAGVASMAWRTAR